MNSLSLVLHIQYMFSLITNHFYIFLQKSNLSPIIYRAQMQLTKFRKLKIIDTTGKNLTVADKWSRSFTKAELQINQLKHKHFHHKLILLFYKTVKPLHYLNKQEEVLPHHKMTLSQLLLIMV